MDVFASEGGEQGKFGHEKRYENGDEMKNRSWPENRDTKRKKIRKGEKWP